MRMYDLEYSPGGALAEDNTATNGLKKLRDSIRDLSYHSVSNYLNTPTWSEQLTTEPTLRYSSFSWPVRHAVSKSDMQRYLSICMGVCASHFGEIEMILTIQFEIGYQRTYLKFYIYDLVLTVWVHITSSVSSLLIPLDGRFWWGGPDDVTWKIDQPDGCFHFVLMKRLDVCTGALYMSPLAFILIARPSWKFQKHLLPFRLHSCHELATNFCLLSFGEIIFRDAVQRQTLRVAFSWICSCVVCGTDNPWALKIMFDITFYKRLADEMTHWQYGTALATLLSKWHHGHDVSNLQQQRIPVAHESIWYVEVEHMADFELFRRNIGYRVDADTLECVKNSFLIIMSYVRSCKRWVWAPLDLRVRFGSSRTLWFWLSQINFTTVCWRTKFCLPIDESASCRRM